MNESIEPRINIEEQYPINNEEHSVIPSFRRLEHFREFVRENS